MLLVIGYVLLIVLPSNALAQPDTSSCTGLTNICQCTAQWSTPWFPFPAATGTVSIGCSIDCRMDGTAVSGMSTNEAALTQTSTGCQGLQSPNVFNFGFCSTWGPNSLCVTDPITVSSYSTCTGDGFSPVPTILMATLFCNSAGTNNLEASVSAKQILATDALEKNQLNVGDLICIDVQEGCTLLTPGGVLAVTDPQSLVWFECGLNTCLKAGFSNL